MNEDPCSHVCSLSPKLLVLALYQVPSSVPGHAHPNSSPQVPAVFPAQHAQQETSHSLKAQREAWDCIIAVHGVGDER